MLSLLCPRCSALDEDIMQLLGQSHKEALGKFGEVTLICELIYMIIFSPL